MNVSTMPGQSPIRVMPNEKMPLDVCQRSLAQIFVDAEDLQLAHIESLNRIEEFLVLRGPKGLSEWIEALDQHDVDAFVTSIVTIRRAVRAIWELSSKHVIE